MQSSYFSESLRKWRRFHDIKQATLAEMLGVSQAAVTHWEKGNGQPSPKNMGKIKDLMLSSQRSDTLVERSFIERQSTIRALLRLDDINLFSISKGFAAAWPHFSQLIGRSLIEKLTDESAQLRFHDDLYYAARTGALSIISGVSMRQTLIGIDPMIRHGWHICVRQYAGTHFIEIAHEPCENDVPNGIKEIVSADGLINPIHFNLNNRR